MKILIKVSTIVVSLVIMLLTGVTAFAATEPTITVGADSGKPGETVNIPVSISNNSGIIVLCCSIDYDSEQLKLTKVTNGSVLTDPAHSGDLTTTPYKLWFDMSLAAANNKNNGVIATLEFELLPSAKTGDTKISVSYNPEEIFDYNLNNVHFKTSNGNVKIVSENATDVEEEGTTTNQPHSPEGIPLSQKAPWDKLVIDEIIIQEKNITTMETAEGIIVRGDNLSEVTVRIQKDDKTTNIKIDTGEKEVLLKENESGKVEAYIDSDGDGVFETPIIEPQPFDSVTDKAFPIVFKILIPLVLVIVIAGFVILIVKRKKSKATNKV